MWLKEAGWMILKKIQLPNFIRPFRFAGTPVQAMYAACIIAQITDITGKEHVIRQVAFVLHQLPFRTWLV